MNKLKRKEIQSIIERLEDIKSDIEAIQEEEQDCYDNLPEGIQDSERGEAISENADDLESASSDLEDIISNLQDIIDK